MRGDVRVERHLIVAMPAPPEPVPVAGLVHGNAINPRAKRRLAAEAMDGAEHTQEDLLREVEGFVTVAEEVHGQLHDHALVLSHQFGAGRLVARCTPLHERGFANADF